MTTGIRVMRRSWRSSTGRTTKCESDVRWRTASSWDGRCSATRMSLRFWPIRRRTAMSRGSWRFRTEWTRRITAAMAKPEPRAREIAAQLLMPLAAGGELEFIEAFAMPFVFKTLCALLGWPEAQWESLGGWVHGNQQAAFSREPGAGKALASLFSEHVKANLALRRAPPHDDATDATDALLGTEVDGVRFDDDQIVSVLRNWTAGHGTVAAGLGILALHLADKPDLQDRLRHNPALIPAAIEEILRADGPLVANPRTTTQEVEIPGRIIPEGERLTLMWIAANRDPRVFDDATAIEIERSTDAGLVWGRGIHFCQGAPLARLEMRVALEELLARTELLEFADTPARRAAYPSNGLATLPLRVR